MHLKNTLILCLGLSFNTFATNTHVSETADYNFHLNSSKQIKLVKMHLSNKLHTVLQTRSHSLQNNKFFLNSNLPSEIQLGMNNVPVLDQETEFNEPVFASTAAIDAALGRGDYISQLCLSKLGHYMASSDDEFSPLRKELSKLENYGIVMKKLQEDAGCENLSQNSVNYEAYHRYSRDLLSLNVIWTPILDVYKALYERTNTEETLDQIRHTLSQGNRVTLSFFVPQIEENLLGTVGTHHVKNDSWLLSKKIERSLYNDAELFFHSMVITGYDDNAITLDDEGQKHKGLLTLRSPWGKNAGDQGDFYMSYDYFRVLVLEAQQIVAT